MSHSLGPHGVSSLSFTISQNLLKLMFIESIMSSNHLIQPLSFPSPRALNLSQHWGLFEWVSSSHQVTKVLELPIQPQSFQWIFTVDFLWNDGSDVLIYHRILKCLLQHHNFKTSVLGGGGAKPPLCYNSHMPTWLLLKTITLTIWALYFLW